LRTAQRVEVADAAQLVEDPGERGTLHLRGHEGDDERHREARGERLDRRSISSRPGGEQREGGDRPELVEVTHVHSRERGARQEPGRGCFVVTLTAPPSELKPAATLRTRWASTASSLRAPARTSTRASCSRSPSSSWGPSSSGRRREARPAAVLGELLFACSSATRPPRRPQPRRLEASETFAILAELGRSCCSSSGPRVHTARHDGGGDPRHPGGRGGRGHAMLLGYGVDQLAHGQTRGWPRLRGGDARRDLGGDHARVLQGAKAIKTPSARSSSGPPSSTTCSASWSWRSSRASSARRGRHGSRRARHRRHHGEGLRLPLRAIAVGSFLSPRLFRQPSPSLDRSRAGLALSLCFGLAGSRCRPAWPDRRRLRRRLVLEDVHFEDHVKRGRSAAREPARDHRSPRPSSSSAWACWSTSTTS